MIIVTFPTVEGSRTRLDEGHVVTFAVTQKWRSTMKKNLPAIRADTTGKANEIQHWKQNIAGGSGQKASLAQIGRWSEALREAALAWTPAASMPSSFPTMIRSNAATGRRAWKLGPVGAMR